MFFLIFLKLYLQLVNPPPSSTALKSNTWARLSPKVRVEFNFRNSHSSCPIKIQASRRWLFWWSVSLLLLLVCLVNTYFIIRPGSQFILLSRGALNKMLQGIVGACREERRERGRNPVDRLHLHLFSPPELMISTSVPSIGLNLFTITCKRQTAAAALPRRRRKKWRLHKMLSVAVLWLPLRRWWI